MNTRATFSTAAALATVVGFAVAGHVLAEEPPAPEKPAAAKPAPKAANRTVLVELFTSQG